MNKIEALRLIDTLVSEGSSPAEKKRAEAQLRELIHILLSDVEETEKHA